MKKKKLEQMRDIMLVLDKLLNIKKEGLIKGIVLHMCAKPKIYPEIYEALMTNKEKWNQANQRQKPLEFISFGQNGWYIIVSNGMEEFTFTIYDIDCRYNMIQSN